MMNAEEKSNICGRLSCFNAPHSTPALRIFHSFSGSHRNTETDFEWVAGGRLQETKPNNFSCYLLKDQLRIPRLVLDSTNDKIGDLIEIHTFCDASKLTYGAAVYVKDARNHPQEKGVQSVPLDRLRNSPVLDQSLFKKMGTIRG
ncbi:hypothetical protein TNCV_1363631 [Trichonephila clavipes]|uniref:Uncharacterized protein n=1 Tax=Trichonephila clavipes TaxID=2585209 RepID=A0A8X6S0Z2_TRICX|nr:hypothetical protein TNCV_1363631 [Trichonephila clavipes]